MSSRARARSFFICRLQGGIAAGGSGAERARNIGDEFRKAGRDAEEILGDVLGLGSGQIGKLMDQGVVAQGVVPKRAA